jgi:ATP-dependent protease ClpP protease subunit
LDTAHLRVDRENIASVMADNTRRSSDDVEGDMLEGTVLSPQQAVDYGLGHEVKRKPYEEGATVFEIASND